MTRFAILTVGDLVSKQQLDITIQSFAKFFHAVTKRHQNRLQLTVLANKNNTPIILRLAQDYKVLDTIKVVSTRQEHQVEAAFSEASLLFLPMFNQLEDLIPKALSKGVPILAYENSLEEQLIDNTCGLAVPFRSNQQSIQAFSKTMKMLYFDSEVQKILRRGAYKKFRNTIQWKAVEPLERRLSLAS